MWTLSVTALLTWAIAIAASYLSSPLLLRVTQLDLKTMFPFFCFLNVGVFLNILIKFWTNNATFVQEVYTSALLSETQQLANLSLLALS